MTPRKRPEDRKKGGVAPQPLFERYAVSERGCWIFTGCRNPDGYGVLSVNDRYISAHRRAWELARGPIPARLYVLHRCDEPGCIRPDHLFLGTQLDNIADRHLKGRTRVDAAIKAAARKRKAVTRCPQGHEYDVPNTLYKKGKRHCRACARLYASRKRAERRMAA